MNLVNERIDEFKHQGFTCFPDMLQPFEISSVIASVDRMLMDSRFKDDLLTIDESKKTHKILYPLNKDESLLKYIVHPKIVEILVKLIDDPSQIVLTWEDFLIKEPFHGIPVTFHQDLALQSTRYDIFSFAVYFHDASHNPVYYLPESFKLGALKRDELYEIANQRINEFVPMLAKAGDIGLHNVKTIHYSEINKSANPRYTWYLEYRTLDQLRTNSPWDEEWIMRRRAIFVAALMRHAPQHLNDLAPDLQQLQPYLRELQLRVPHTNDKIKYDMESPYNHFT